MQCDQIGRFFIVPLATNFLTKVAKIICECLDHYYKHLFIVITAWLLFGQLLEIFWAFFIPTSGHADGRVHARARINFNTNLRTPIGTMCTRGKPTILPRQLYRKFYVQTTLCCYDLFVRFGSE